ncbi:unnamed protein product [Alopecurus aequalis]
MARAASVLHLLLALFLALQSTPASADTKSYVVFSKDPTSVLYPLIAGLGRGVQVLHDFKAINGIGINLDAALLPALQNLPGVLAVIPDRLHKVQTTHSWEFLGLESGGKPSSAWGSDAHFGEGVIIANVDTGVSPMSQSFEDDDVVDFPKGWRGTCDARADRTFRCNKKLIGARLFNAGIQASNFLGLNQTDLNSPRDYVGHGSHTLSTVGGGFVEGASAFGRGNGTAKGGSPRARVASYKACFVPGCSSMDILAAILAAVEDGVHVLSLSVGAAPADYSTDLMAIGTLYAVQRGVAVVASAGNEGPEVGSVSNVAPWMLTVGASTMDRSFPAYVTFGNTTIKGQSLSGSTQPDRELISGEKANAAGQSSDNSTLCLAGSLDPDKVNGKIVVCTRGGNGKVEKGLVVKRAGGIGMVLCNDASSGDDVVTDPHFIPAAHCSFSQCKDLFQYLQATESPVGYITANNAELGVKPAPTMAYFSSRGPNSITPQILKPDITAPGVSVIAAYSPEVSATGLAFDDRHVPYNVLSGTSMSCPHVAGIAGLLKNKYPKWSPAMIKSAIMTTASTGGNDNGQIQDETGAPATPFSYGSGHVSPISALDPGLVYNTTTSDYANFLCSVRPTQPRTFLPAPLRLFFSLLFGSNPFQCSLGTSRPENLNYPSISACLSGTSTTEVERRVTNVGTDPSPKYNVSIVQPAAGVKITVEPTTLVFSKVGEEKKFNVKLEVSDAAAAANYVFGSIEWTDGTHRVRSPVVATTKCK